MVLSKNLDFNATKPLQGIPPEGDTSPGVSAPQLRLVRKAPPQGDVHEEVPRHRHEGKPRASSRSTSPEWQSLAQVFRHPRCGPSLGHLPRASVRRAASDQVFRHPDRGMPRRQFLEATFS
jgi:hypothetical protein